MKGISLGELEFLNKLTLSKVNETNRDIGIVGIKSDEFSHFTTGLFITQGPKSQNPSHSGQIKGLSTISPYQITNFKLTQNLSDWPRHVTYFDLSTRHFSTTAHLPKRQARPTIALFFI
ncbi:hypothetical protein GWI33_020747 [Rhynchophorus ferrugineus]|uniref:Uncharacterized protein n=1 Tax=Rhynchophorus ferrugineus TaxID=354439 RepID=A0A834M025_RHYFE|nr:hypothetical protein GWI33_020747 [Rhynchophorus ferrugineus]